MQRDETADDGQAQTQPALRAIQRLARLREHVEDARLHRRVDADAGVANADDHRVRVAARADLNRSSGLGVFGGVGQEIRHNLRKALSVGVNRAAAPGHANVEMVLALLEQGAGGFDRVGDDVGQLHVLFLEVDLSARDAGHVEEVADEADEVADLPLDDRALALGGVDAAQLHELQRRQDGGERIAQLVAEHRDELVLRTIRALGVAAGVGQLGHVGGDHDDPVGLAIAVDHRLIHELEERLLRRSAGSAIQQDPPGAAGERLSRSPHLVEELLDALVRQFRQRFEDRLAKDGTVCDELEVRVVRKLVGVVRSPQDRDGDRRLPEDLGKPLRVRLLAGPDLGAQDLRVDPRAQLTCGERLHEVIAGARLQAFDARLLAGTRRQQDHRDRGRGRICLQFLQQLEAVEPGHHHVGDDQRRRVTFHGLERRSSVRIGVDAPTIGQQAVHVLAHVHVVVGEDDAFDPGRRVVWIDRVYAAWRGSAVLDPAQGLRHVQPGTGGGGRSSARLMHPLAGQMCHPPGNGHRKRGALVQPARNRQCAAVHPDQLVDEREPDAGAFLRAGASALDPMKPLEDVPDLAVGNAHAGVAHAEFHHARTLEKRQVDRTVERELQGVREKVQDDLLPHLPVHVDRLRQRWAVDHEFQAGAHERRPERAGDVGRELGQVGGHVARVQAPGFNARELEERVDQLEQAQLVAIHDLQGFALERPVRRCQGFLGRPEDQRQGRAELVTDVAEEHRLRPIELRQRFGALALRFVGAGVPDGGADLVGDELEKRAGTVRPGGGGD